MKEETFQLTWDHHDPYFRAGASLKTVNTGWRATPFGTLKAKTWHQLAASYDGAALRAYQDGKYIGQVAATGSSGVPSESRWIPRATSTSRTGTTTGSRSSTARGRI